MLNWIKFTTMLIITYYYLIFIFFHSKYLKYRFLKNIQETGIIPTKKKAVKL